MRVYNETLSEALPLASLTHGDNSFLYCPPQATAYYRSYFLIEIHCREGFQEKIGPSSQESELKGKLKGELKALRTILDLITENPEATTTTLVATGGKSRSTVQKCIKILKEENCIDRVGGKKYGKWVVIM